MNSKSLSQFQTVLLEELVQTELRLVSTKQNLRERSEAVPIDIQCPLDLGKQEADLNSEIEAGEIVTKKRSRLLAALTQLKRGSYGRCRDCSDRIALARPKAEPSAVRCLDCEAKRCDRSWRLQNAEQSLQQMKDYVPNQRFQAGSKL